VTPRKARRLARRAVRRDPPGRRGRRALRLLERAVRDGDHIALRAMWECWLVSPSPPLWEILSAARDMAVGRAADETWMLREVALGRLPAPGSDRFGSSIAAALRRTGHPVASTAAALILAAPAATVDAVCAAAPADPTGVLTAFCLENGLLPADPVARAMFRAWTGQGASDTGLLAAGYSDAHPEERRRVREAMAGGSEADLVDVVAGPDRARVTTLIPGEITDLITWLTGREDWAGLWRLAGGLSPRDAVELVRSFPDFWRPDDPAGQRLFELLAGTPAEAVTAHETHPLPVPSSISAVSYAPDGTGVAILESAWPWRGRRVRNHLIFLSLPERTLIGERRWRDEWISKDSTLLHVDDTTVVRTGIGPQRITTNGSITWAADEAFGDVHAGQHRDGWVTARWRTVHLGSFACPESPRVVDLDEHGLSLGEFAVEPATGRFAVLGAFQYSGRIVLFESGGRKLAECVVNRVLPYHRPHLIVFAGPESLITAGYGGGLARWHHDGDELRLAAMVDTPKVYGLRVLPALGKLLVEEPGPSWHSTESLLPVRPGIATGRRPRLWTSPDDRWTVAADDDGPARLHRLIVPPALARLLDHPLADTGPADLAAAVEGPQDNAAVRVLRACLEHRLGAR
jgi:hypothetical protein